MSPVTVLFSCLEFVHLMKGTVPNMAPTTENSLQYICLPVPSYPVVIVVWGDKLRIKIGSCLNKNM